MINTPKVATPALKTIATIALCGLLGVLSLPAFAPVADVLFPQSMQVHVILPAVVPTSPTDVYTSDVWLISLELAPQSTTSPTCTIKDKTSGTPLVAYNASQLGPNVHYRDTRPDTAPLFMKGGLTWSCSDNTVVGQLTVKY